MELSAGHTLFIKFHQKSWIFCTRNRLLLLLADFFALSLSLSLFLSLCLCLSSPSPSFSSPLLSPFLIKTKIKLILLKFAKIHTEFCTLAHFFHLLYDTENEFMKQMHATVSNPETWLICLCSTCITKLLLITRLIFFYFYFRKGLSSSMEFIEGREVFFLKCCL